MSYFLNDGSCDAPKLKVYLNLGTLVGLRSDSVWFKGKGDSDVVRLKLDGFEGVQLISDKFEKPNINFSYCGQNRIDIPADADRMVVQHADRGDLCLTLHAGWGLEDDDESFRLVEAILTASAKYRLPIFLETHRATITQDMWRTVQLTKHFPELRFNGDFSHYYCGQELVYGDWSAKLEFMKPILDRIGFLHGRIASSGCMQVPIDEDLSIRPLQAHGVIDYLDHFRELWTRSMSGFVRQARAGDVLIFAPELLAGTHYYARLFPDNRGKLIEETDRYAQAILYRTLAHECFARAGELINKS